VLDACEQLQAELAALEEEFRARQAADQEAEKKYQQWQEEIEQAKKQLAEIRTEREREGKQLAVHRKKAGREKKEIDQEVEKCRQQANVTRQEITAAAELKAVVERSSFSLGLMLELSREFAGYEDVRERLAEGLKKCRTLAGYLTAMDEQAEASRKTVESEMASLESRRNTEQAQITRLQQARHHEETVLSQLQADVADEQELRWFYRRYHGLSGLMEYLASWGQVIFLHCNNPLSALAGAFAPSAGGAHFWTDKPATRCPHCGSTTLIFDEKPYQALNWPVGSPLKLQLGG
jgi:chromosome segregation ATPase